MQSPRKKDTLHIRRNITEKGWNLKLGQLNPAFQQQRPFCPCTRSPRGVEELQHKEGPNTEKARYAGSESHSPQ
jgi:hypothetical protein